METFAFVDALTGDGVAYDRAADEIVGEEPESPGDQPRSVFFPGCSMINYAMPLVEAVYDTLVQHEVVDGISVLCCGKILSYEPDGDAIRASFEDQLRAHVAARGIERLVCACPNCVKALRDALSSDPRTAGVEIAVLPVVLAELGYRLDRDVVVRLVKGDGHDDALLCPHDSCPDRDRGEFADGIRALMPDGMWVDPAHCRRKSLCCGSLPRAAGKAEAADRCADICGRDSRDVGADVIVTACMSCAFQLNVAQFHLPVVHFLELLYDWRIDWSSVGMWLKVRFLFDETLGVTRREGSSGRAFAGLGAKAAEADRVAAEDVPISNEGVDDIGL